MKISSDYLPFYHIDESTGKPSLGKYDFSKFMELKRQEAYQKLGFTPSVSMGDQARIGGVEIAEAMDDCRDGASRIRLDAETSLAFMHTKLAEIRKNNGIIQEIDRIK